MTVLGAARGVGFLITSAATATITQSGSNGAGNRRRRRRRRRSIGDRAGYFSARRRAASEAFYSYAQCELFSIIKIYWQVASTKRKKEKKRKVVTVIILYTYYYIGIRACSGPCSSSQWKKENFFFKTRFVIHTHTYILIIYIHVTRIIRVSTSQPLRTGLTALSNDPDRK